jgi:hypothetical protein
MRKIERSPVKYLCLAYYDETKFDALPKSEVDALVAKCRTHDQALRDSGSLMLVGSLARPKDSKSIRPQNGRPSMTDGPYAETKEQVGAFFIVEAKDLDEAVMQASKHPAAHLGEQVGWGIEVRPIEFFNPAEGACASRIDTERTCAS